MLNQLSCIYSFILAADCCKCLFMYYDTWSIIYKWNIFAAICVYSLPLFDMLLSTLLPDSIFPLTLCSGKPPCPQLVQMVVGTHREMLYAPVHPQRPTVLHMTGWISSLSFSMNSFRTQIIKTLPFFGMSIVVIPVKRYVDDDNNISQKCTFRIIIVSLNYNCMLTV